VTGVQTCALPIFLKKQLEDIQGRIETLEKVQVEKSE
jgi:hypothetical protein